MNIYVKANEKALVHISNNWYTICGLSIRNNNNKIKYIVIGRVKEGIEKCTCSKCRKSWEDVITFKNSNKLILSELQYSRKIKSSDPSVLGPYHLSKNGVTFCKRSLDETWNSVNVDDNGLKCDCKVCRNILENNI